MEEQASDRPGRDFPYYRPDPAGLSAGGWLIVLAACAVGFAWLTLTGEQFVHPPLSLSPTTARVVGVVGFLAAPVLGLRLAAGRDWLLMFPRPRWKDVGIGLAFAPLTLLVSLAAAYAVFSASPVASNPAVGQLNDMDWLERAGLFAAMAPQLLGEELITLLPFLALLAGFHTRLKTSRRTAILLAWFGSAVIFGALHLPTYDWHLLQSIGIIGSARLVLTLPYLITRSIWASTTTHIANDWTAFGLTVALHQAGHLE